MNDHIDDFLRQRAAEGASPASIKGYRFRFKLLCQFALEKGIRRWPDMKVADLDPFPRWLRRKRGLAFSSTQSILFTTQQFFEWLARQGRVMSNPARYLRLRARADDKPLPKAPLSEQDVANILSALPRRNVRDLRNIALIELLYSAGLRISEALALNLSDIDLSQKVIFVKSAKGCKPRDIPIVRGLNLALSDYLALRRSLLCGPDNGVLLLSTSGRRFSEHSARQLMRKINRLNVCKRNVHAHLFRHSIAVHLLRGGADIRYIQQFLGHELLETTKIYLRLVPTDVEVAYHAAMPQFVVNV